MTKVEELRDTITTELSAFYEDRRMDNPAREAALYVDSLIAAAKEEESAKIVHCGDCAYAAWESQEPHGKGEGIACHVIAGRSRPWLGAVTDYCSEGRRKVTP